MDRQPGKYERLYLARHERDLALSRQEGGHPRGLWFDVEDGNRVVEFVEGYCRHAEGEWAGAPLLLEEWQKQLLRIVFGWKRLNGTRRFRTAYIEIPRKNGKSALSSALALYLLMADGEPGAQVYSFATKEEQAAIVWRVAASMAQKSPDLKRFLSVHGIKKKTGGTIWCDRESAFFRTLGADSSTQDGLNPHGAIADELHEHKDRDVWTKLRTATGARRQPMQIEITTAGVFDPESIGWLEHQYAIDILEETIEDESFFAFIAAADEGPEVDVFSVETQQQANPNYGVSAKVDMLADIAQLAKNAPSVYNDYLRYHLNRWTQQVSRWLSIEQWRECDPISKEAALEIREAREKRLLEGKRRCWGGLDLAQTSDLNALVLAFEPDENNLVELLCRFYLPEETVKAESKKKRKHYERWVEDGWIIQTPGRVTDYEFIRRDVKELRDRGARIEEIAFDKLGAGDLTVKLEDHDGFKMVVHQQGFVSMNAPSKEWERRTINSSLRHGGHPVLAWNVGNAVTATDSAGSIKPDKKNAKGKIDGLVAGIMGLGRLTVCAPIQSGSYLEHEQLISF